MANQPFWESDVRSYHKSCESQIHEKCACLDFHEKGARFDGAWTLAKGPADDQRASWHIKSNMRIHEQRPLSFLNEACLNRGVYMIIIRSVSHTRCTLSLFSRSRGISKKRAESMLIAFSDWACHGDSTLNGQAIKQKALWKPKNSWFERTCKEILRYCAVNWRNRCV